MEKIIGLDMSTTSTGWAFFYGEKLEAYGCLKEDEKYMYQRLINMRNQIRSILNEYQPEMVIIEEIPISEKSNLKIGKDLCLLQGLVIGICSDLSISFMMTAPSKWRAKVGILRSIYTCDKCGRSFEAKSGLKHLECPECENTSFSRFKKAPLNTRKELKKRAVETVNEIFGLDLYFKNSSRLNQDDEAESILLAMSELAQKKELVL